MKKFSAVYSLATACSDFGISVTGLILRKQPSASAIPKTTWLSGTHSLFFSASVRSARLELPVAMSGIQLGRLRVPEAAGVVIVVVVDAVAPPVPIAVAVT